MSTGVTVCGSPQAAVGRADTGATDVQMGRSHFEADVLQSDSNASDEPFALDAEPDPDKAPFLVAHFDRRRRSSSGHLVDEQRERANAVVIILARNRERAALEHSLEQFEDTFNGRHHYPYLFLNDALFDDEFITSMQRHGRFSNMTFGKVREALRSTADRACNVRSATPALDLRRLLLTSTLNVASFS